MALSIFTLFPRPSEPYVHKRRINRICDVVPTLAPANQTGLNCF